MAQGNLATHLRCGGILAILLRFFPDSDSEIFENWSTFDKKYKS